MLTITVTSIYLIINLFMPTVAMWVQL